MYKTRPRVWSIELVLAHPITGERATHEHLHIYRLSIRSCWGNPLRLKVSWSPYGAKPRSLLSGAHIFGACVLVTQVKALLSLHRLLKSLWDWRLFFFGGVWDFIVCSSMKLLRNISRKLISSRVLPLVIYLFISFLLYACANN